MEESTFSRTVGTADLSAELKHPTPQSWETTFKKDLDKAMEESLEKNIDIYYWTIDWVNKFLLQREEEWRQNDGAACAEHDKQYQEMLHCPGCYLLTSEKQSAIIREREEEAYERGKDDGGKCQACGNYMIPLDSVCKDCTNEEARRAASL